MAQQTTADERSTELEQIEAEADTASTRRLLRLLENTAQTLDSEDTDLALFSQRAARILAQELRDRGCERLAREAFEGDA